MMLLFGVSDGPDRWLFIPKDDSAVILRCTISSRPIHSQSISYYLVYPQQQLLPI